MFLYLEDAINNAINCIHDENVSLFSNLDLLTKLRRVQTIIKRIKVSNVWKNEKRIPIEGERDLSLSMIEVNESYNKNICSLPVKISLKISDIIYTYDNKKVPKE
jgi:hypothetical protein